MKEEQLAATCGLPTRPWCQDGVGSLSFYFIIALKVVLLDLVNKNTVGPVKAEFQISNSFLHKNDPRNI